VAQVTPGVITGDIMNSQFIPVKSVDDISFPRHIAVEAVAAVKKNWKLSLRTLEVPPDLRFGVRFTAELDRCPV